MSLYAPATMQVGFLIGSIFYQKESYTTLHLAHHAYLRGHEVFFCHLESLEFSAPFEVHAQFWPAPLYNPQQVMNLDCFFKALVRQYELRSKRNLMSFDLFWLRFNPAAYLNRNRFETLQILEGLCMAEDRGLRFVNKPSGLFYFSSKLSLARFPQKAQPQILISRQKEEIESFFESTRGPLILKPLNGFGGRGVYLLQSPREPNFHTILSSLLEQGPLVAQSYVSEGHEKRIFVLDGKLAETENAPMAYQKQKLAHEFRLNAQTGSTRQPTVLTLKEKQNATACAQTLLSKGIRFAGLDMVDAKLIETNVFCPGGLGHFLNFKPSSLPEILRSIWTQFED